MRNDNKSELQHYVPQLLLRLHLNNPTAKKGTEHVWCFDKLTDSVFSPNIANILAEKRLYEIEFDGQVINLEESLSEIENTVAPIFARIVAARTIGGLSDSDRVWIARFCAVQLVRTPRTREQMRDTQEAVLAALKRKGFNDSQLGEFKTPPSEAEVKLSSIKMLVEAPRTFAPHFLAKHWHLIESTPEDPFHLGDHPIAVDTNHAVTGRTATGIASPGVSIYLPLSSTLCLVMTDPALMAELNHKWELYSHRHRQLLAVLSRQNLTPEVVKHFKTSKSDRLAIDRLLLPFRDGTPSPYDRQVTRRANSLQMLYASRWIVSSKPDFALENLMIADNEDVRTRPRLRVD
jgi:hypothetical protein